MWCILSCSAVLGDSIWRYLKSYIYISYSDYISSQHVLSSLQVTIWSVKKTWLPRMACTADLKAWVTTASLTACPTAASMCTSACWLVILSNAGRTAIFFGLWGCPPRIEGQFPSSSLQAEAAAKSYLDAGFSKQHSAQSTCSSYTVILEDVMYGNVSRMPGVLQTQNIKTICRTFQDSHGIQDHPTNRRYPVSASQPSCVGVSLRHQMKKLRSAYVLYDLKKHLASRMCENHKPEYSTASWCLALPCTRSWKCLNADENQDQKLIKTYETTLKHVKTHVKHIKIKIKTC